MASKSHCEPLHLVAALHQLMGRGLFCSSPETSPSFQQPSLNVPRISFPISPPGRAPSWDRGAGVLTRSEASLPSPFSHVSSVRFPGGKVSLLLSPLVSIRGASKKGMKVGAVGRSAGQVLVPDSSYPGKVRSEGGGVAQIRPKLILISCRALRAGSVESKRPGLFVYFLSSFLAKADQSRSLCSAQLPLPLILVSLKR